MWAASASLTSPQFASCVTPQPLRGLLGVPWEAGELQGIQMWGVLGRAQALPSTRFCQDPFLAQLHWQRVEKQQNVVGCWTVGLGSTSPPLDLGLQGSQDARQLGWETQ